jgi:hypothetical protein
MNLPPLLKHALDALASVAGALLAMANMVNVVSLLTLIWWTLRIYETPTVQRWLKRGQDQGGVDHDAG